VQARTLRFYAAFERAMRGHWPNSPHANRAPRHSPSLQIRHLSAFPHSNCPCASWQLPWRQSRLRRFCRSTPDTATTFQPTTFIRRIPLDNRRNPNFAFGTKTISRHFDATSWHASTWKMFHDFIFFKPFSAAAAFARVLLALTRYPKQLSGRFYERIISGKAPYAGQYLKTPPPRPRLQRKRRQNGADVEFRWRWESRRTCTRCMAMRLLPAYAAIPQKCNASRLCWVF